MTRRDLFFSSTAALLAANISGSAGVSAHQKTYILVHGAWHGGWCWQDVRELLESAGHRVFTPSLTGLGDRVHLRHPSVDLTTHATDIVQLMVFEDLQDIILVGHSYAGHVVSVVADMAKERLSHIVYLDAVLATNGRSFLPPGVGEERAQTAKDGYLMPIGSMKFLGIPEEHPRYDWVKSRLVEHPLPTLMETVQYENGGPAGVPKTFIRCLQNDRMLTDGTDPVAEMVATDAEWNYLTIDTGHDLMITAPEETARILLNIS
ncbi:MAG: alpha/beta fold hydrolase [Rhodospirillaceae bacterium]